MIGNIIEFRVANDYPQKYIPIDEREVKKGLVVDAFTEVRGSISGKSETFLGCGEGRTSGKTYSERMYKIQVDNKYRSEKNPEYIDIYASQLKKIVKLASDKTQEINEEKMIIK